ncbi:hypothetical protein BH18THE2_BH18THE2_26080 [soil metagenome]
MTILLEYGRKYTQYGIPVIPTKNKIPVEKWTDRRNQCATEEELVTWFSNGKADGIAIPINNTEFAIDTDGTCESLFINKVVTRLTRELREAVYNTTHTKTPNGHHRLLQINAHDFPEGIKEKVYVKLNDHNEIALKGRNHCLVERGPGYEIINDIESLVSLRKEGVEELLKALEIIKAETNGLKTIVGILLPYYTNGRRDNLVFGLSGYLHKNGVSESFIFEVVESLVSQTNDEELQARLRVVKETCSKDPNSDQVSGYNRLLEALDNNQNAVADIEQVLNELGLGSFNSSNESKDPQSGEVEKVLPSDILLELTPHIYKLISYNPLTFIVADQKRKEIIKSIVATPRKTRDNNNKSATTTTTSTETTTTTTTVTVQRYIPKNVIIDAIPTKVIINDNPLDGNKTYQITFTHKASKKPFTLGPGTVKFIVEELQNRGRYVSKDAVEALAAILTRYEDNEIAEINNKIPYPGYYFMDGKIIGCDITQRLDFDPYSNQEHKKEALECIDVLEGLQSRNKKKTAFPTLLKWVLVTPFSFIIKTESKGIENALQGVHLFDRSDTGKSTLSIYAVLAVWRKHDEKRGKDNHLGPGSIDSPYRFGQTISKSTYPVLVDEVGALGEDRFYFLVEMIKYALLHRVVRSGKFSENKRHSDILALSDIIFTSNPQPPRDPAYRRRFIIQQYTDSDKLTEDEKKEFKHWLLEEDRIEKLGVLGDFVAKYIIEHPDLVLGFKDSLWHKPGEIILREFYKAAGKEPPSWIELVAEQSAVQDSNEEKHFELVGFLRHTIQEAYRRDVMAEGRSGIEVDLQMKINDCLKKESIPFLYEHKRNKGEEVEVVITSNVLSELKRYNRFQTNSSNYTLAALASEIPGFKVDQRKINGANKKVACGPKTKFDEFLTPTIQEMDE